MNHDTLRRRPLAQAFLGICAELMGLGRRAPVSMIVVLVITLVPTIRSMQVRPLLRLDCQVEASGVVVPPVHEPIMVTSWRRVVKGPNLALLEESASGADAPALGPRQ